MIGRIAAFEWRYQLRSPVFWVGCVIFFLLTFGATTVDQIHIGSVGNVHKNSPYAILETLGTLTVFSVFIIVAMIANVIVRDDETGFAPILRSTSISKASYLVGRFTGASAAALMVLASVPLAILLGSLMPWQDAEKIGPLHIGDYLFALFAFALPTLLIIAAGFFAVATATRSMMWTYVAAVGTLVAYIAMRGLLRDPAWDRVAALCDPFGMATLAIVTKYWTAADRNTLLPAFTGLLLWNRVIWAGVALALFALAWRLFRFDAPETRGRPVKAVRRGAAAPPLSDAAAAAVAELQSTALLVGSATVRKERITVPDIPPASAASRRAQWWALAKVDMLFVFRSPAFFVLLLIGLLNCGGALWFAGDYYGTTIYPVTRVMVQALHGSFTLFPIIIAIYYASELVWRDRDRRMHEIIDATPAPDLAHLLPKIVAIAGVLVATALVGMLAGIVVQTFNRYTHYEPGAYLAWFVWPVAVTSIHLAVLSVFVQVLVRHKYVGWAVMVVYLVASISLFGAGFEHGLYNFGATPQVPLSDFNGQDRFWIGQAWFQLYWTAFSAILVVVAYLLWRRGTTMELWPRLLRMRGRLHGGTLLALGLAIVAWVGSGAWIFYNTNVLNVYRPSPDREALLADYEKTLLPFENAPQPRIADVTLDVQIYPRQARAVTTGSYRLVNRTAAPIDVIYLGWGERARLDQVALEGATVKTDYPRFHYRVYQLARPMQPGEERTLGFTTTVEERGFPNGVPMTRIVRNGTFLDNFAITPRLGMTRRGLLQERAKRRKYGLPAELRPPKLEDDSARAFNELSHDSDWVTADITVGTDADQTPIAPGVTLSDRIVEVGGVRRHVARFKTDAPINQFFSVQSARYEVQRDSVKLGSKDVALAVWYLRGHDYNVERMLAAMKTSLVLFNEKFSPYQFEQARILEFPAYERFAQSFANTIPYSEDIGFLGRFDPDKIDVATYVTAHEIGHQWWGHQLMPSDQQGASMLVESFAQYSALLVMERVYGRDQVRQFLKYELDRYLRARGGEVVEELPLDRVENQGYIHYQKGTLAMYWAKEVIGEEVLDRTLAKFLAQHAFKGAPYPNARDFLALLRAEAGPQHDALITDLFEKITLYDLKVAHATATKRPDGKYALAVEIDARKVYADGKGVETEAPMDELVEFGVFTAEPGKKGFKAGDVMLLDKRRITTGHAMALTLVFDQPPKWVGIDPYNKRIDRNSDDNVMAVTLK